MAQPTLPVRRRITQGVLALVAGLIPSKLARIRANQKTNRALAHQFGDLRSGEAWDAASVGVPGNESKQIAGIVVRTVQAISPVQSMLLAGEAASAKPVYASFAGIAPGAITTAGLHADSDHQWNFEQSPPSLGRYQCIVSYAVLEHLIDPYRHVRDLAGLLESGGHLVVFTVSPGFPYHRHPIDCQRFFPDWFETVGARLGLEIADRFYGSERIMYRFRKP